MSNLRLTYRPREDTTPEEEIQTLRHVYRFLVECHERRNQNHAGHGEVAASKANHAEELSHEPASKEEGG